MTRKLALIGCAVTCIAAAAPAQATFPGRNGRIAYADYMSGQIYTINPDGSARRKLTHVKKGSADSPAWSPGGASVAFVVYPPNGPPQIWTARADGTHASRVLHDAPGFGDRSPSFSPSGKQIVFTRCHPEPKDACAIWRMGVDGSHKRALTPFVDGPKDVHGDFDPSVSPNGKRIAFTRFQAGGFASRVFVMGANGSHPKAITAPSLEGFQPDWAPSGGRITFSSAAVRTGSSVFTVKPNGKGVHRLTPGRFPHNDALSTYSPRGDRIAFVSDRSYPDTCCNDLFTMKPSGARERRVHTHPKGAGIITPAWGSAPLVR